MVYVAVPLPVPGCQRLSGILQFIFVREHLPIVIFYLYLYFKFKVTHLAIVVSDLCKYLSEFVLSCKSEFIGVCLYLFCVCFSYIFLISFQRKFCKSKLLKKKNLLRPKLTFNTRIPSYLKNIQNELMIKSIPHPSSESSNKDNDNNLKQFEAGKEDPESNET